MRANTETVFLLFIIKQMGSEDIAVLYAANQVVANKSVLVLLNLEHGITVTEGVLNAERWPLLEGL